MAAMSKNFNISSTQITPLIRVSSAAIWYDAENRYQVETLVFSDDARQPFRMWIHGSVPGDLRPVDTDRIYKTAVTFHRRVSRLLRMKFRIDALYSAVSDHLTALNPETTFATS